MCARYSLDVPDTALEELFALVAPAGLRPRFNVAPTQTVPVVRAAADGRREVALLRWGLVPSWADDVRIGAKMINARAETVAVKPSFRSAFRRRRCLVPATGFYEWRAEAGGKQPYHFRRVDARPFAFAGLWETRPDMETFTILTTDANETVRPIHDRMPVVIAPAEFDAWLAPDALPAKTAASLLRPSPAGDWTARPVSKLVNNPRVDDPRLMNGV